MFILKFVVLLKMDVFGIHFAAFKNIALRYYLSQLMNFLASPYNFAPKVTALLHLTLVLALGLKLELEGERSHLGEE